MSESRQTSLRRAQLVALIALAAQIVFSGAVFAIAGWCKSRAVMAEAYHLAAGIWLWLVIIVHLRHQRAAQEEIAEVEELERVREQKLPGSALFEGDEEDLNVARNRLKTFEKYFLPLCSLVMVGLLMGGAVRLYVALQDITKEAVVVNASLSAAFLAGIALASFIIGKYAAGMATERVWRPLRAGGSLLVSSAIVLFVVCLGMAFVHFKLPAVDRVLAYVVPGAMCLVGAEMFMNILLDIYRPRVEGQEPRFSYDSRLLGLLVEPAGVAHTVAQTLDYQFGFRVSETWGYRFIEHAIAPLILFQVVSFYLLTCVLIVGPDEKAFVERFGRPKNAAQPLGPGLHLKWPWPIEIVRRFPAERIFSLRVGEVHGKGDKDQHKSEAEKSRDEDVILWTRSHSDTVFRWMVASASESVRSQALKKKIPPVSFLTGVVDIFYRVDNLYNYMYLHSDGHETLRQLSHRALSHYMTGVDFNRLITSGRRAATDGIRLEIQTLANEHKVGVEILSVGPRGIQPPIEVGPAYESVVAATVGRQAIIMKARAYESELMPKAAAEADVMRLRAEADSLEEALVTAGKADRFQSILSAHDKDSLDLFMMRHRVLALVDALANARKYIVPSWAGQDEVDVIDLQEKLQLDILDAQAPDVPGMKAK